MLIPVHVIVFVDTTKSKGICKVVVKFPISTLQSANIKVRPPSFGGEVLTKISCLRYGEVCEDLEVSLKHTNLGIMKLT